MGVIEGEVQKRSALSLLTVRCRPGEGVVEGCGVHPSIVSGDLSDLER